ncbi:GTP:adenosylcobinamide-phosphate guanylyltransferase [Sphingobium xenophagum]|uniref:GTP:adenosylcobinamide-phosphate guanylyltransferase n=1 Tax=Sphingobium xenophagum TaxID=121428 RepID=A0ABU1X5U8_SPHXE|nr:NTP transferase domain-containing protein [Sphingobium xenophagum]MDR7156669.1 GTP:adenosylcobinamide-phosphate guanylyltransferase [Sphingobium xenophagum]
MGGRTTALVLAGKRDGATDPLALEAGVTHKCLVPVVDQPMLVHVIDALAASERIGEIRVAIEEPEVLASLPQLRGLLASGRLVAIGARPNLVDSVLAAADGARFPLLITTADNVLLTPPAIAEMLDGCVAEGADAAVAFARRASVLAAHPEGQRKFYAFADDSYSNCNSYWLKDTAALAAAETFRSGGQFVKHPLRIIGAFGLLNLLRFRFGIGTLAATFARFSRRFSMTIAPVILSDGSVAIDVDNARTRTVASEILSRGATIAQAAE